MSDPLSSNQPDTVLPTVRRFSQWCLVSHGHDMLPRDDGAWVRYDEVRAEIERLRAALQWYADNMGESRSHDMRIMVQDGGKIARNALAEQPVETSAGHSHADSSSLHAHSHAPEVIGGGNRLKVPDETSAAPKAPLSEPCPKCRTKMFNWAGETTRCAKCGHEWMMDSK